MGLETAAIIGITSAVSAGAGAGASIYGANKASSSNKAAMTAQERALAEQLAYEREIEATRRAEFDRTEAINQSRWQTEADRDERRWALDTDTNNTRYLTAQETARRLEGRDVDVYNIDSRRKQPYRDTSLSALQSLAQAAGLTVRPTNAPQLAAPPPVSTTAPSMSELARFEAALAARPAAEKVVRA